MNKITLQIDKKDNVFVALKDLAAGTIIMDNSCQIRLLEDIPAKHKFFIDDIKAGEKVIMYGVVVGILNHDILQGERMSIENTSHATDPFTIKEAVLNWQKPDVSKFTNRTFNGYHRSDGRVGTANYWLFIPTVFCENRNLDVIKSALNHALGYTVNDKYFYYAQSLVDAFEVGEDLLHVDFQPETNDKIKRVFKNIDGIKFLNHSGGCGGTRQDAATLSKLLAAYADHPNVAGITLLSLGCQHLQIEDFKADIYKRNPAFDKPFLVFEQQKALSEELMIQNAILQTFKELILVSKQSRQAASLDKLCIGVKCGASDGFSGISANPAVGYCADLLVGLGGKVLLAEFPELCGAEQQILDRMVDRSTAEKFVKLMTDYNNLAHQAGSGFHMNPSPGNIKDGLITDAIKSTGAAKKGGTSVVVDVLDYTEIAKKPGLSLVCTPGNDVEATTGQTASGATIILFTTGLGTPTGNPVCPTVKISSNTSLAKKMSDIIDLDTGSIISGEKTIEQVGEEILEHCIKVASGESIPKAVLLQQDDFIPWKRGVSLKPSNSQQNFILKHYTKEAMMNTGTKKIIPFYFIHARWMIAILVVMLQLGSNMRLSGQEYKAGPAEKDYAGYLFAYFKGNAVSDEALCYAISTDGYNYRALNQNQPVLDSKIISSTGGIRDPHILRGIDGQSYYMVLTDMTSSKGWDSNRAMVLLKSTDLISWKHTVINIQKEFKGNEDLKRVWAPQTIYDPAKEKYMVYWSMKHGNGPDIIYYAYANDNFSGFISEPKVLFTPKNGKSCIDGDIINKNRLFYLFYKTEGHGDGIKLAITDSLTSGKWIEQPGYKQQTKDAVEGSGVFKLNNSPKYILMYDVYGKGKYQFCESYDLDQFKVIDHEVKMDFHPRHGTIIPLTRKELVNLTNRWGIPEDMELSSRKNPVLEGYYADPDVLYSNKTKKYYIYPTSDGFDGWGGTYFKTFSSSDLKSWKDEGVILDLKKDVSWANRNAWAPTITEKKVKGKYKYYYYFTAAQKIGVAVSDLPTGPFKDSGKPLLSAKPEGIKHGQVIDPDVFTDPKTAKNYIYWGNGFLAAAELNDDMISLKENTTKILKTDNTFREGTYVFFRKGMYYFLWSENDTRSENYRVRYGTSSSPTGPISISDNNLILQKDPSNGIYGTGHNSVLQIPGKDEWYVVYHRFSYPEGIKMGDAAGFNREVCIDRMYFDDKGNILPVKPTP